MFRKSTWAILSLSLLLMACNSEEKMIQKAAYGYLDAMGNYRIKEAEQFASKETVETTLHVVENNIMPNTDPNYIKRNTPATIEITGITKETDTTAVVSYKKTTPIQVQSGTLNLIKRDEKWQAVVLINVPQALLIPASDSTAKVNIQKAKNMQLKRGEGFPDKFKKE